MAKEQVGFEWNVQPYRWLSELRYRYTQAVIVYTKYSAEEVAKEATQWMRENAIWADKDIYKNGKLYVKAGTARKNLIAYVDYGEEQISAYNKGRGLAERADEGALIALNRQRELASLKQTSEEMQRLAEKTGTRAVGSKSSFIPLKSVPSNISSVAKFERQFEKNRSLLVDIKFTYSPKNKKLQTYAIWLEIAHGGRFGIISRAVQHFGQVFKARLSQFNNLKQFQGGAFAQKLAERAISPEEEFSTYVENFNASNRKTRTVMTRGGYRERDTVGGRYQPFTNEVRAVKKRRSKYYQKKNKAVTGIE